MATTSPDNLVTPDSGQLFNPKGMTYVEEKK